MIQTFKTNKEFNDWLNDTPLKSNIIVYVEEDKNYHFSTNNVDGEFKTYFGTYEEVESGNYPQAIKEEIYYHNLNINPIPPVEKYAETDLSNITAEGENKIKEVAQEGLKIDLPLEKGTGANSLVQTVENNDVSNITEGQYSIGFGLGGITKLKNSFTYATELNYAYLTGSETTYTVNKIVANATVWNIIKDYVDPSILIGSAVMLTTDKSTKHFITNATKDSSGNFTITVDSTLGNLSNKPTYLCTLNANSAASIIGGGLNVGQRSNMLGFQNFCKGNYTNIIGSLNIDGNTDTKNGYSIILGYSNANSANYSALIGSQNKNNAKQTFIIGSTNTSTGENSSVLGGNNTNNASNSAIIGLSNTNTSGVNIFNLGMLNTANANYNHLFGHGLNTTKEFEGAFGTYNVSADDTIFSVGTGQHPSSRKNGLEIKTDGTILGKDGKELAYKEDVTPITPNVIKFGDLTIDNGQMLNFNSTNYAQFPFLVDLTEKAFEINMQITTASDVTTQQNILDSKDGLAFAIRSGKFVLAVSNNGTSWSFEEEGGTVTANTTYLIRLIWDKATYSVIYSIDNGISWNSAFNHNSTLSPYPRTMLIGKDTTNQYIYKGSINLNKCTLSINGQYVWDGMTDAGLLTRLDTSLSNIDADGIKKIKEIIAEVMKG